MNERIREVRRALDMTQSEFAAAIGKTRDAVATYESGRVTPDDTVLELLELKYHYRADWIRTGKLPKKLQEPVEDSISETTVRAAYMDETAVRQLVHKYVDALPPHLLKIIVATLTDPDFPQFPPPDPPPD